MVPNDIIMTTDNRPIGVFDSGMGGLTALRELIKIMPNENYIYFGDTGRVPYGGRSVDTIIKYSRQDVAFLRTFNPKAILIACNTISTTALPVLSRENDLPIIGVVEPAADVAVRSSRNKRIGVIGTKATIRCNAYANRILKRIPDAYIVNIACPLFVPLVENGRVKPGDHVAELVVEEYLKQLKDEEVDTVVLGCTHYPLLSDVIQPYLGESVTLVNSGKECSESLKKLLTDNDMLTGNSSGSVRYYVSDSVEDFSSQAPEYLGSELNGPVERIAIEKYETAVPGIGAEKKEFSGLQILVVDDDELDRKLIGDILEELGATITYAEDGKMAVEIFEKTNPGTFDVILMDIMMPVMNGYQATNAIRTIKRSDALTIPIIGLSANAFAEGLLFSKNDGMNEHLSKPLNLELLKKTLKI